MHPAIRKALTTPARLILEDKPSLPMEIGGKHRQPIPAVQPPIPQPIHGSKVLSTAGSPQPRWFFRGMTLGLGSLNRRVG